MTDYVIPVIFVLVIATAAFMRKAPYSSFVEGAAEAFGVIKAALPYLVAVMIAVALFRESGVSKLVSDFLFPVFGFFGLPKELCELILIRPLSGAGALGVLDDIFVRYGPDSFIGNCASVVYGSSETVFYLSSVYFSKCKAKKLGFAVPVALLSNFVGYAAGCFVLSFFA